MTLINGQPNRSRHWRLKVVGAACLSGVIATSPFAIANSMDPGDTPIDLASFVAFGLIIGLPQLLGFALGRFWLVAFTCWVFIYWKENPTDLRLGLMAATLLAGSMSFLCHVLNLRTYGPRAENPKVTSGIPAVGKFRP